VPGFKFPFTKMDIGSFGEETDMAAGGKGVALGLPGAAATFYGHSPRLPR